MLALYRVYWCNHILKIQLKKFNLFIAVMLYSFEGMGGDYNIPMAANAKTVRDFDGRLTRGKKFCKMKYAFFVTMH